VAISQASEAATTEARRNDTMSKYPPMCLNEAVTAVSRWLSCKDVLFMLGPARALSEQHFQVSMQQVFPEQKALNFQVIEEQVPDCWRVVEVTVI
jgi:hypothetical protein